MNTTEAVRGALSRPALDKRVLIRCTTDTTDRINELHRKNRGYTRSSIVRTAMLIGLAHMEESAGRNGTA